MKNLRKDDRLIFKLKADYEQYGYKKFKMSKFEEYDLYLENKSFLLSENIITFNDHNGKLLALKPDITLSIVKNTTERRLLPHKVYYSENVYRSSKDGKDIKEIMQMGVEYIGDVDAYATSEVLLLAIKSLKEISNDYIFGLSHMGIISGLLDFDGISIPIKERLSVCISNKNTSEIKKICDEKNFPETFSKNLIRLAGLYGPFEEIIEKVEELAVNETVRDAVNELKKVYSLIKILGVSDKVRLDFSIMNDMNYYNGIIFQGFINSIPSSVLSGGRYDNLVRKLGGQENAIGFALYLDLLERYFPEEKNYDVDALIIYPEGANEEILAKEVKSLTDKNLSVRVQKNPTENIKYKSIFTYTDGGLKEIE